MSPQPPPLPRGFSDAQPAGGPPPLPAGFEDANNPPALKQPEGSAASRVGSNFVANSPLAMFSGKMARIAVDLGRHAFDTNAQYTPETQEMLGGIVQSHIDQAQKAKAALAKGDKMEAFGHSLATLIPMLGPAAAAAGEKMGGEPGEFDRYGNVTKQGQSPDIAGGVGAGLGVLSNVVAPDVGRGVGKVVAKLPEGVARAVVPKISSTLNPVEQGAVDYARGEGVPLTAGTITGNKFVKALQATTQNSPLGAQTAAEFNRGTEVGVQRLAGKLADQTGSNYATPESVGKAIPAKLQKTIENLGLERDEAYEKAWRGRDDPEHTRQVPVRTVQGDEVSPGTGIYDQEQVMKPVNMPVDVREIKEQVKPLYDEMQWMPAADRASSAGYQAVKNILDGDDFIPAWQAERGLGGLKTMARVDSLSGVRNSSQGLAAGLIPKLQGAVDEAVANTGEDAIRGLQNGRAIHAHVMDVADLADQLREEPVQNFGKLTWQGDTGLGFLRKIQEQAPEQMQPLGRAYVQQMIDKATEGGGFSKTQGLLNRWNALGDGTKRILYPDPDLRANLGKFFKAADMVAQNPNPSGTALVQSATSVNPVRWAAGYLGSKLFFDPRGIALLTDNLQAKTPGMAALTAAKIRARAGTDPASSEPPEPPDGGPTPGPSAPRPTPATPPTGAAALRGALDRNNATVAASRAKLAGTRVVQNQAGNPAGSETIGGSDGAEAQPGAVGPRQADTVPAGASGQAAPGGETAADTRVSIPGSDREYKARYAVRELADVQASHNGQSFQPNPKYPYQNDRDYVRSENQGKVVSGALPGRFDPRYLLTDNPDSSNGPPVVDGAGNALGGNGRAMMMQRVYSGNPQGAQSYRNLLALKAPQFGVDAAQVRSMKQPVLVREIDPAEFSGGGEQDAITDFNKVGTASLRGSEKAVSDSRRVSQSTLDDLGARLEAKGSDSTLAEVLDGKNGTQILNRLIQDGVVGPQERAAYVEGNALTADGKARIGKLVLGRFFRDPAQLDRTPPAIRQKLERIAAPMAQVEGKPEWSLAEPMQQALDLLEGARAHGFGIDDFLHQSGLFRKQEFSPQSIALAKQLVGNTQVGLTKLVRQYAADSHYAGRGEGLFGEPPTPAGSFEQAFGKLPEPKK